MQKFRRHVPFPPLALQQLNTGEGALDVGGAIMYADEGEGERQDAIAGITKPAATRLHTQHLAIATPRLPVVACADEPLGLGVPNFAMTAPSHNSGIL